MNSVPKWFFLTGAIFVLVGMVWGIQMSATQDHSLSPAHAHLNLVGFVSFSIFGAYYALTPSAANSGLAKIHYAVGTLAVVLMVPGIVMALTQKGDALAKAGSVLAVLSVLLFIYMIAKKGVGQTR